MRNGFYKWMLLFCWLLPMKWDAMAVTQPDILSGFLPETSRMYYAVEIQGIASSGKYAPFWLQSNRYGTVSERPYSGNLIASVWKPMKDDVSCYEFSKTNKQNLFGLGFGAKMIGQVDGSAHFLPQEYYVTGRIWLFDATVGSREETWGNQDPDLSSGGFLFSGNARPIPRITVGISRYRAIPYLYGYLEIKGGLTHGWFVDNEYIQKELYHHKFVGVRLGGKLPVNLSYEFHHVAQWGGVSPVYGNLGHSFGDFINTFLVRSGGSMKNDQLNAQGNHIGSQQLGLDVNLQHWRIHAYWQQIFEDGPIKPVWAAMNVPDGLWGISVSQNKWPYIGKLLLEYLNTTDQSGPVHDLDGLVFGGNDSYFQNSIYANGWNHYLRTIGTPFITSPVYNNGSSITTLNNRVQVFHAGIMGDVFTYRYRLMASYSRNFGTYRSVPLDRCVTNTAVMLEVGKHFQKLWDLDFSASLAADFGAQFGNSVGVLLTVRKSGWLNLNSKKQFLNF